MPCSMPSALRSSSMSGQWTPWPSPMRRQFARWAGVASERRHDHASGTLITRPSTKWAVIESSVTSTRAIRDSTLTAVLIPSLDDDRLVLDDMTTDVVQLSRYGPGMPEILGTRLCSGPHDLNLSRICQMRPRTGLTRGAAVVTSAVGSSQQGYAAPERERTATRSLLATARTSAVLSVTRASVLPDAVTNSTSSPSGS